jgi:hypothetical protein
LIIFVMWLHNGFFQIFMGLIIPNVNEFFSLALWIDFSIGFWHGFVVQLWCFYVKLLILFKHGEGIDVMFVVWKMVMARGRRRNELNIMVFVCPPKENGKTLWNIFPSQFSWMIVWIWLFVYMIVSTLCCCKNLHKSWVKAW